MPHPRDTDREDDMGWTSHVPPHWDDDTRKLLEIATHFLHSVFGHTPVRASGLMRDFLRLGPFADEDMVHHEGPYSIAAVCHYRLVLQGPPQGLVTWLVDNGHHSPPPEVFSYINAHYFQH